MKRRFNSPDKPTKEQWGEIFAIHRNLEPGDRIKWVGENEQIYEIIEKVDVNESDQWYRIKCRSGFNKGEVLIISTGFMKPFGTFCDIYTIKK